MTATNSFAIRDATPRDLETIVEFNAELARESEGLALDQTVLRAGVTLALNRSDLCRYFVATHGDQTIGQTMLTYELTDWRNGVLWWIQSVYIRPKFRGQGAFRSLFNHIRNLAQQSEEVRGLRLYVEQHNAPALATYTRLGMRPTGHLLYEQDWSECIGRVEGHSG